ncbi:hypothetical protein VTI28DRAFT_9715 [Corynascus sepedonium]
MNITPDVSPAAIRDAVQRVVGVEASLAICARVRDEIVRRIDNPQGSGAGGSVAPSTPQHPHQHQHQHQQHAQPHPAHPNGDAPMYNAEEDPEVVLQNALHALQQEEADAEAQAAAEREARDRSERGLPPLGSSSLTAGQAYAQQAVAAVNAISTPVSGATRASVGPSPSAGNGAGAGAGSAAAPTPSAATAGPRFIAPTPPPPTASGSAVGGSAAGEDLTLTPIPSGGPVSVTDRPVRCPFCLNQRMLRTIKEAVEHMSTHVIV